MTSKFTSTNGINIHYLENIYDNDQAKETVILMHGLTANAYYFSSILEKMNEYHVISVDLRGRGLSDKPDNNYSMEDHAMDIIGLMDALGIEKCVIGGHSFGARLSIFLAAKYPDRFSKVILIDAAAKLHPNLEEMITPSLMRLGKTWDSFDEYLAQIKDAPFLHGQWSDEYLPYFKADVKEIEDGSITTQSIPQHIHLSIKGLLEPGEKWLDYITHIKHPTILINATGDYSNGEALLPKELAMETVEMIPNCKYEHISGNHITMLFGIGAEEFVNAIKEFLSK